MVFQPDNTKIAALRNERRDRLAEVKRGINVAENTARVKEIESELDQYPQIKFDSNRYEPASPSAQATDLPQSYDEDDNGDEDEPEFGQPLDDNNRPIGPSRGKKEADQLREESQEDFANQPRDKNAPESAAPAPRVDGVTPAAPTPSGPRDLDAEEEDARAKKRVDSGETSQPEDPDPMARPKSKTEEKKDEIKQEATDKVKKKFWDFIKDKLTKEFLLSILANPYVWGAAIIIIVIIVVIALFAYFAGSAGSGVNGKTPLQPVDPIANTSTLEKLTLLSGNADAQKELTEPIIDKTTADLIKLKESTTDADKRAKIEAALAKLEECKAKSGSEKTAACAELIDEIRALLGDFDNNIPIITGKTRSPLDDGDIKFNQDLHLGALLPSELPDEEGHYTYIQTGENSCDAVDVYTKDDAAVYPAFPGTIVKIDDDATDTGSKLVVLKSTDGNYEILYAFVTPTVTDMEIKEDELNTPIGTVAKVQGISMLHIELTYCGRCLASNLLDKMEKDQDKTDAGWGQYYWNKFSTVLNLDLDEAESDGL